MDLGLKKRLIGAAVLIVLAVIFVPMLLPNRSDSGPVGASLTIPPPPSGDMQTRVLQLGPDSASAGADTQAAVTDPDQVATLNVGGGTSLATRPQPTTSAAPSATSTVVAAAPVANAPVREPPAASAAPDSAAAGGASATQATVAVKPPVAPAAAVAKTSPALPVARTQPQPVPGGPGAAAGALYTVNLGIYADHASANKLVASAKAHGFTALASPETFQGKPVLRVRIGPYRSHAMAEAARLQIKRFAHVPMTVNALAINQQGDAPATALAANRPGAWAVQLGAFNDEGTANALRDRLRGQRIDGYVDGVVTASGKLWRVRAGPYASRAAAKTVQAKIANSLKIEGAIVTQH